MKKVFLTKLTQLRVSLFAFTVCFGLTFMMKIPCTHCFLSDITNVYIRYTVQLGSAIANISMIFAFLIWLGSALRFLIFAVVFFVALKISWDFNFDIPFIFGFILFILLGSLPTRYLLWKNKFVIQKGLFFKTIAYGKIEKIYKEKYFLDDKFFKIKKVCIEYKKESSPEKIYYADVFPKDTELFIKALESKIKK